MVIIFLMLDKLLGIQLIILTDSYIVDFEMWHTAENSNPWSEGLYILWNLRIWTPGGKYEW